MRFAKNQTWQNPHVLTDYYDVVNFRMQNAFGKGCAERIRKNKNLLSMENDGEFGFIFTI